MFGTIISPHMAKKNSTVWRRRPLGVAAPIGCATSKKLPRSICVNLYVSGLATIKKMSAEMNAYLAFNR